jgi:hypothetical protein
MYCNVYVPRLQYTAGLVGFVHHQLGLPIASTAPLGPSLTGSPGLSTRSRRRTLSHGWTSPRASARTT